MTRAECDAEAFEARVHKAVIKSLTTHCEWYVRAKELTDEVLNGPSHYSEFLEHLAVRLVAKMMRLERDWHDEIAERLREDDEEKRDPYAYRGLSRSDFL